jgi:sugar lactone lactonase YvrE
VIYPPQQASPGLADFSIGLDHTTACPVWVGVGWQVSRFSNLPMKGIFTMRFHLKSIVAVFALICSTSPIARAVDILYVTRLDNKVQKFDTVGNSLGFFATTNMNQPRGLAFDSAGNLFVANQANNTISKYNSAGVYVSNITSNLSSPQGLAFDSSGNLYAANQNSNTITKYNSSGTYLSSIGDASNVYQATGVAITSAGNIYASSLGYSQVNRFNSTGTYQSNINSGVDSPYGVTLDSTNNLFVANWNNNTVTKYNSSGALLSTISSNLYNPVSVTFDSQGYLYVLGDNGGVNKFNSSGTFMTSWNVGVSSSYITFRSVVPEPSTYALVAIATGVMAAVTHRRRQKRLLTT